MLNFMSNFKFIIMTQNKSKSRTLVNVIGIPCLLGVIWSGGVIFSLFVGIVMSIGAFELCSLSRTDKKSKPLFSILLIGVIGICILYSCCGNYFNYQMYWIIAVVIASMILEIFRKEKSPLLNISVIAFGLIWVGLMIGSMITIRNIPDYGFKITIGMFLSVWICDTFAFFFGSKFGKKKILPLVSPNKSWVGSISGMVGSIIFMCILHSCNIYEGWITIYQAIIFGFIFGGLSQFGDFSESVIKREFGLKDTSNILQGHGGILDRFDSLAIASPLALLYIVCIGKLII